MREHKFKAWWKDTMEPVVDFMQEYTMDVLDGHSENPFIHVDWTGLRDKNSVEVYRGDRFGGIWEHSYVDYCDKCVSMQLFFDDFGCAQCSGDVTWQNFLEKPEEIEVTGNIYEGGK